MRNLIYCLCSLLLVACYEKSPSTTYTPQSLTEKQQDSLNFLSAHHYTNNYNFVIDADSMVLLFSLVGKEGATPEEAIADFPTDTFVVHKDERIVVADIRIIPTDTIDTVWVQVADSRALFGWVHEGELLNDVVPDDPISQFINTFSNTYILLFLSFLVVIAAIYMVVKLRRKDIPFVHLHDINSFYPTLLCLVVALSAILRVSIQMFCADMWQHFYFYPTLNPFSVPLLLSLFLITVWAIIIIGIAVVDVVFKQLPVGNAFLYLGGTLAVCAVAYVIFSLTTRFYLGYLLWIAYVYFALWRYFRFSYKPYVCGRCGRTMRHKGRCPHCGALNE